MSVKDSTSFFLTPRALMRRNAIKKLFSREETNNRHILEIGYGSGYLFPLYETMGLMSYGYDFSELAYNYVVETNSTTALHLYRKSEDIPLEMFDYVSAFEVLEHIEGDVAELCRWRNYLKSNGKLILSVPAHKNRWDAGDVWAGHFRRYEKNELNEKLEMAGFAIDTIYTYDFPACVVLDRLRDISRSKTIRKKSDLFENKTVATKRSGVIRDYNPLIRFISNPVLLAPLVKLEELFYNTDFGSCYVLMARRT